MDTEITLHVDSAEHVLRIDTRTTLLDALREPMGGNLRRVRRDARPAEAAAAAVVNAAHHATGVRVRSLPATADDFLG